MKSNIISLKLNEGSYYTLLRSVIESWPREVMGEVYGKKKEDSIKVSNSYNFLTADRKPTFVSYGNIEALNRLRRLDEVVKRNKYLKNQIVGGFHSHVISRTNRDLPRKKQNSLSKEDLDFIRQEMELSGKKEWVEILMRIEKKEYLALKGKAKKVTFHGRKMKVNVRDKADEGYEITFSAFLIDKEMKSREIQIRNGAMTL